MSISKEYRKMVPNSDTVVLFLHGILASPSYFDPYIQALPPHWSVCNLLLEGHGGSVREFSTASIARWKQQAEEEFLRLTEQFETVIIVAHSMGTLFALDLAVRYPNQIKAMFLVAPPLKLGIKPSIITCFFKIIFEMNLGDDAVLLAGQRAYGIEVGEPWTTYVRWVPIYWHLLLEIYRVKREVHQLEVPNTVVFSQLDELVPASVAKLFVHNPTSQVHTLPRSKHFYYPEEDYQTLMQTFHRLVESVLGNQPKLRGGTK